MVWSVMFSKQTKSMGIQDLCHFARLDPDTGKMIVPRSANTQKTGKEIPHILSQCMRKKKNPVYEGGQNHTPN